MKKIFLTLLVSSFIAGVSAQPKKPVKKNSSPTITKPITVKLAAKDSLGNIIFEKVVHDFGNIPQGVPATFTFKFTNTNPSSVTINHCQASCGCTAPNWTKEPIPSGGTGIVAATYNAASVGSFNKSITVQTNLGSITLTISGVVIGTPTEPEPSPIKIGGQG